MKTKQNQSSLDLAIQSKGDAKAVLDLCLANGLSLTGDISPGLELFNFETEFKDEIVINFFELKEISLATAKEKATKEALGIGTMIINTNFDIT